MPLLIRVNETIAIIIIVFLRLSSTITAYGAYFSKIRNHHMKTVSIRFKNGSPQLLAIDDSQ